MRSQACGTVGDWDGVEQQSIDVDSNCLCVGTDCTREDNIQSARSCALSAQTSPVCTRLRDRNSQLADGAGAKPSCGCAERGKDLEAQRGSRKSGASRKTERTSGFNCRSCRQISSSLLPPLAASCTSKQRLMASRNSGRKDIPQVEPASCKAGTAHIPVIPNGDARRGWPLLVGAVTGTGAGRPVG
jgi:hypothetical protein